MYSTCHGSGWPSRALGADRDSLPVHVSCSRMNAPSGHRHRNDVAASVLPRHVADRGRIRAANCAQAVLLSHLPSNSIIHSFRFDRKQPGHHNGRRGMGQHAGFDGDGRPRGGGVGLSLWHGGKWHLCYPGRVVRYQLGDRQDPCWRCQ